MIIGRAILFLIGAWLMALGIGMYSEPGTQGDASMGALIGIVGAGFISLSIFLKGPPET